MNNNDNNMNNNDKNTCSTHLLVTEGQPVHPGRRLRRGEPGAVVPKLLVEDPGIDHSPEVIRAIVLERSPCFGARTLMHSPGRQPRGGGGCTAQDTVGPTLQR